MLRSLFVNIAKSILQIPTYVACGKVATDCNPLHGNFFSFQISSLYLDCWARIDLFFLFRFVEVKQDVDDIVQCITAESKSI